MNMRFITWRVATAAVCFAAFAVVGVAGARTTDTRVDRTAADRTALVQRVLRSNELPGFVSMSCPLVVTDAGSWARGHVSSDALRRNGFVEGLRQPLHSDALRADALSVVARFSDAAGARREVEDEFAAARSSAGGFAAFSVPLVPGARGFALLDRGPATYGVLFSDGRFEYLVRAGAASRAQVVAVATALYRRVHGRA
jgi:hypothetical protein